VGNNGKWGIYLGFSKDSTLRNNLMSGNRYNFGVSVDFIQDIDTSNKIDNKPIIFWVNKQNDQVPTDAAYVAIVDSYSIEARNLQLANNGQGIAVVNSAYTQISSCNITGNSYCGIALIDSNYNTLSNNTITRNDGAGIAIVSSTGNSITNNTIQENVISIHLQNSKDNTIHHNNLINNTRQAVSQSSTNTWDDGYPSGGNYWSDYSGKDSNNDGIGDTPYTIDASNQDKYPLMTPVTEMPISNPNPFAIIMPFLIVAAMAIMIAAISTVLYKSRKAENAGREKALQHVK
jgi:parallel beta-helix repeat protein